ncbi:uncharacterized protein SPSK_02827 [Sporothrix schenckii 1099-18]|uniref:Uncharacterized protein n=1 Tax=Sporothrix schenckii 1099-18 TaxID=1397361 RepID=A0A0F2M9D1_SPOSC|nr:uncharacterized protein SPSK_02827 [Sporothrix schenckii 1099-18]KJR86313.1 hypothetical protein SPSK_02827 [Sporothrix schenckii 1099-18]
MCAGPSAGQTHESYRTSVCKGPAGDPFSGNRGGDSLRDRRQENEDGQVKIAKRHEALRLTARTDMPLNAPKAAWRRMRLVGEWGGPLAQSRLQGATEKGHQTGYVILRPLADAQAVRQGKWGMAAV